jgi:regulator of PEP synthase PpsR (kinase-PPPase family)
MPIFTIFLDFSRKIVKIGNMKANKTAYLSTILSEQIKEALAKFCRKRGLKMSRVIEEAIREHLEDEADISAYELRKHEERISFESLLKNLK